MTHREDAAISADARVGSPDGRLWPIVLPLALSTFVFWPITRNYFFADDLLAIYDAIHKPLLRFLFEPYGGHVMATRNLVYLFLYHLFGPNPAAYFFVVLLNHLLNVGLLFLIIRNLTSTRLACFGAGLWGAAAIHEGALGWYQAYGVVMASTAQLWIVHRLVQIRRSNRLSQLEVLSWGLLLFGASTSFGTGIAITVAMPGIAWLVLPPTATRRRATIGLALTAVCVTVGYFALQQLTNYLFAKFRLTVVTTALRYWDAVLWTAGLLTVHGLTVLFLGPLAHHASVASAPEYALTAAAAAALGIGFATARPPMRRLMLACLLPFAVSYLLIAAGRGAFLSVRGTKMVAQAHYHYSASLPLAMLAALLLNELARRWRPSATSATAALALWYAAFAAVQISAGRPIEHHGNERRLADQTLAQIKTLVLSQPPGSDVYIRNGVFYGVGPFVIKNPHTFPGIAGLFAVYHPDQMLEGRRVFFVETEDRTLSMLRDRPFAGMLTPPDNVPAGAILELPPPT